MYLGLLPGGIRERAQLKVPDRFWDSCYAFRKISTYSQTLSWWWLTSVRGDWFIPAESLVHEKKQKGSRDCASKCGRAKSQSGSCCWPFRNCQTHCGPLNLDGSRMAHLQNIQPITAVNHCILFFLFSQGNNHATDHLNCSEWYHMAQAVKSCKTAASESRMFLARKGFSFYSANFRLNWKLVLLSCLSFWFYGSSIAKVSCETARQHIQRGKNWVLASVKWWQHLSVPWIAASDKASDACFAGSGFPSLGKFKCTAVIHAASGVCLHWLALLKNCRLSAFPKWSGKYHYFLKLNISHFTSCKSRKWVFPLSCFSISVSLKQCLVVC